MVNREPSKDGGAFLLLVWRCGGIVLSRKWCLFSHPRDFFSPEYLFIIIFLEFHFGIRERGTQKFCLWGSKIRILVASDEQIMHPLGWAAV